jgi:hypothetical protein
MRRQPIPQTDSIRELAEFWDTHEVPDFDDELEEVKEPVFEREPEAVVVHLRSSEAAAVKRLAQSKGVASADVIEEWVRQKVHSS